MAATQETLYGRLDLALSWSEAQLPQRERTKHVHRLHPYLGKFVPQLVEELLERNLEALRRDLTWAHEQTASFEAGSRPPRGTTRYVRDWFAPRAAAELLHFRGLVEQVASVDVLRVVLARAARSARRAPHFDLDFPRAPA